jgi:hypothetical protein
MNENSTGFHELESGIICRLKAARMLLAFLFFIAELMHTVLVMIQELSLIREQRRLPSPKVTPQALAWDSNTKLLWMGSRDLRRIYNIDAEKWRVVQEIESPGIPWAAVATNGTLCFTIGEGPDDDRYIRRFVPKTGVWKAERIACPELTGSYLSYDGEDLYLSQWYKHRILKLDATGKILREIGIGAEICGHTFVDGAIYVLRGKEQPNEDWRMARLDPREDTPEIKDIAIVPFACRSLAFDGEFFWTNHRAADETVSFRLPTEIEN